MTEAAWAAKVDDGRVRDADGHSHVPSGLIRSLKEGERREGAAGTEDHIP